MADERTNDLKIRVNQGDEIRRFLENSTVRAVFQGLELSYFTAWKAAVTPADREKIHATVSAFDALRDTLQGIAESGDLATQELELAARDTD